MAEQRETYRGREIVVRTSAIEQQPRPTEAVGAGIEPLPELYIDGEPIVTRRVPSGAYIAAGLAYSPERSLVDLAKRIIDSEAPAE